MKCRVCKKSIPKLRLEVLPETRLCVKCSEKVGGDFEVVVFEENVGSSAVSNTLRFKKPRDLGD
jgi:hypothetical protein